jgi:hypothetical protein
MRGPALIAGLLLASALVAPSTSAAWVNGALVLLTNYSDLTIFGSGEGRAVSSNGDYIVGFARERAARWR